MFTNLHNQILPYLIVLIIIGIGIVGDDGGKSEPQRELQHTQINGFFQFVNTYRMNSRAGLALLDRILRAFEATGLGTEARARHFRVIGYYISGAALDEALGYARGPSAAEPVPEEEALRDFPAITAAGAYFGREHHAKTFEQGVEVLLADLAADVAALPRAIL